MFTQCTRPAQSQDVHKRRVIISDQQLWVSSEKHAKAVRQAARDATIQAPSDSLLAWVSGRPIRPGLSAVLGSAGRRTFGPLKVACCQSVTYSTLITVSGGISLRGVTSGFEANEG